VPLRTENHRKFGSEPNKIEIQRENSSFEDENRPVVEWPTSRSCFDKNRAYIGENFDKNKSEVMEGTWHL